MEDMEKMDSGLSSEISQFVDKEEVMCLILGIVSAERELKTFEADFNQLSKVLGRYQEQPMLINPALTEMISPLADGMLTIIFDDVNREEKWQNVTNDERFNNYCKVIQLISRVRGFKHVYKLLPHEVYHLEPILFILLNQDKNKHEQWETSIDSSLDNLTTSSDAIETTNKAQSSLVQKIIHACLFYLKEAGPSRDAASTCLSALLTRPDMDLNLLSDFIATSCDKVREWHKQKGESGGVSSFEIIGILLSLSQIFKKGHRSRLLPHATKVLEHCLLLYELESNQTIVRKLLAKLIQQVGMTFLPPRMAKWRYQRGHRSLLQNLAGEQAASGPAVQLQSAAEDNEDDEDDEEVVEELEGVIDALLTALSDSDTVVRWSAAKGLGRITMRLPKSSADDVVGAVLETFEDYEADSSWHGGCLAIAELTRRGLLLPDRLAEVIPVLVRAINYDILRGQHSVGSHVRDAACFVCWAFARAYSPQVMRPFISKLSSSMLITAVYDREINCRRAASAAFQENVGRQGNENFPNGIDIITIADYFALGNRAQAYIEIAPLIAKMEDGNHAFLVEHLIEHKLLHWDQDIRVLAAKGLAALATINPERSLGALAQVLELCFNNNVLTRHGATMAAGEMFLALHFHGTKLPESTLDVLVGLVPKLEKARLFRGRGAEVLRQASCQLLEHIAKAHLPVAVKVRVSYVEFLNENVKHPQEYIQQAAVDALRSVLFSYFVNGTDDPTPRLQDLTTLKYMGGLDKEDNVAAARGYALALGALPAKLLTQPHGRLDEVIEVLSRCASVDKKISGEADAETRRNCVLSAVEIVEKLCLSPQLTQTHVASCVRMLFLATKDYSVDKRGDTGSWSRIVALRGLERLVYCAYRCAEFSTDSPSERSAKGKVFLTLYGPGVVANATGEAEAVGNYCLVAFDECSLGHTYATALTDHPHIEITRTLVRPVEVSALSPDAFGLSATGDSILRPTEIVKVMLTQLSEKLDMVRVVAGGCLARLLSGDGLERILHACDLSLSRSVLLQARDQGIINWSQPAHVFPLLSRLMESKEYFTAIMNGIVIAVGGLSETVVKESSAALMSYCKAHKEVGRMRSLLVSLTELFVQHKSEDRVIVPLVKTLNLLLHNSTFESLRVHNCPQLFSTLEALQAEAGGSSNVIKIRCCIDAMIHLLRFDDPVRGKALKYLVVFLGHKYPRIRKYAAEQLYLQILSDSDPTGPSVEDMASRSQQREGNPDNTLPLLRCGLARDAESLDKASELLVSSSWDGQLSGARAARQSICDLLGLQMGKREVKAPSSKGKENTVADELDNYMSLVKDAGY